MKTKQEVINDLRAFVAQRSGIEVGNYVSPGCADLDGWRALQADRRLIGQQGRDARALLAYVEASLMDFETLVSPLAGSGRLSYDSGNLNYTAGQYFATEYRASVCRALAAAIWAYWNPAGLLKPGQVRQAALRAFGRGLANRWFN